MRLSEGRFNVLVVAGFLALIGIVATPIIRDVNAHSASATARPFRVITYQHEDGSRDSVRVVWDTRIVQDLDPGVTDLTTKLASAGWTRMSDAQAVQIPKGCVIRVVAPSQERPVSPSVYGPLENCKPGMTLASILFSQHSFKYPFGSSAVRGIYNVSAPRRG